MSDPHWEKVKDIFQAALYQKTGADRERYLHEMCAGDGDLRDEVQELIDSFEDAGDFLNTPPISEVAETIVGKREDLIVGQQFGRYRIERRLGAGGVGEVFLAHDTELGRFVALKILSAEFSANPDHVRRFAQEARAASALNHPNILTIYESGEIENVRFIAAEYVEGETLRERLRRGETDLSEILEIVAQTAAALNAAHLAGIVHRDIKPENIMLRRDALVKVLDFGLAKLVGKDSVSEVSLISNRADFKTTPGLVMGTVAYMSPEQARGLPTDERTDIWSLGVCLSESFYAVQPFAGGTTSDQIAAILKSEPEPQDAEEFPELQSIIKKCLEKKIENRYQTIGELLFDINNLRQETELLNLREFSSIRPTVNNETWKTRSQNAIRTGESAPASVSSAEYIAEKLKKPKLFLSTAALMAFFAVGLILYFSVFNSSFSTTPTRSIAVLPFVNESGGTDGEYLSDGLSESLINKFSQLPQLKVASRSSAFQFKDKPTDTREIARDLQVEAIVNGRVTRLGDNLQISVELINTADNTQLWGETYRRKISEVQTIEDEIAQTVLQKLRINPSLTESNKFNQPITSNGQAYQLYLNGVFYRRKNGPENVRKAIEYQNQAIALDPNFALAYAELGFDYYIFVGVGAVDSQTGLPPARAAIEKALSLNDGLAEAHDINARLKAAEFDWSGAETEIRRAIELNANLASAHTYYSELLSENKRFDEALREIRRARELDPLRINLVNYEAEIYFRARRYDEAQATYDSGNPEAVNETFALINRARVAAAKSQYPEAFELIRISLKKDETVKGLIHLARLFAISSDHKQAIAILERLKKTDQYVSPAELSILYAALSMRELAFESLERAYAEKDSQLPFINVEPEYDLLRDDPRFVDLLRRINLKTTE